MFCRLLPRRAAEGDASDAQYPKSPHAPPLLDSGLREVYVSPVSNAVKSSVDPTRIAGMALVRRVRETDVLAKLVLLERLRQRHSSHADYGHSETRIEQSFNEQLFARVLGYQTMFSHDETPFHLLPKNFQGGKRYDDFSLGFFGVDPNRFLALAELKGPETDLDRPQTSGGYGGKTPVQQAFDAASATSSYLWVIVCNFRELRLYAKGTGKLLACADLHEVRTRSDLALLEAHFDRLALLGDQTTEPEMTTALDPTYPSAPIGPAPEHFRLVLRFVPQREEYRPLHRVERALKEACSLLHFTLQDSSEQSPQEIGLRHGWITVERSATGRRRPAGRTRLACNSSMEVISSSQVRFGNAEVDGKQVSVVAATDLCHLIGEFVAFLKLIQSPRDGSGGPAPSGHLSAEVFEVQSATLLSHGLDEDRGVHYGSVSEDRISASSAIGVVHETSAPTIVANCLREIAIQFRDSSGGVELSEAKIAKYFGEIFADAVRGEVIVALNRQSSVRGADGRGNGAGSFG